MEPQAFERKNESIRQRFVEAMRKHPDWREAGLKLSWSNWGFGVEPLEVSADRLSRFGVEWIELHGNRYGADLGYRAEAVRSVLDSHGLRAAGVCGMFGPDCDLSAPSGVVRQRAVDYIRRQLDLCRAVGGSYLLVVPAAVGRPEPYDAMEVHRSVETLGLVADDFAEAGVQAAIEPIRSAEVSCVHTVADALAYIARIDHPAVGNVNGDVYHMQVEESHIPSALMEAGDRLVNLHLADSNRCALGEGSLDLDAILMALYAMGYVEGRRFCTPEPLGSGGDPYPAMHGSLEPAALDALVETTVRTFRKREEQIKTLLD
jgi:D-psicose/D-tagatose/L-ribulose 3-epimerase